MGQYFEDLSVGDVFHSPRSVLMTRAEVIEFAREWDPQLYHIDDEAARESVVGEIFASAIHTLAISQKLAHESGFFDVLPVVGLGLSAIEVPKPVLIGDRVRVRVTVMELRPSSSRPGLGVVTNRTELLNQADDVVMRFHLSELVRMRPTDTESA
ncbi:MAG: MaoC/PaaZ C-terminal domain-containing protein [Pseudomonadota bacterium]